MANKKIKPYFSDQIASNKKIKPYRVSYYFSHQIVYGSFPSLWAAGRVRLHSQLVRAADTTAARAELRRIFGNDNKYLVIVNAYPHYRLLKEKRKAHYIKVAAPGVQTFELARDIPVPVRDIQDESGPITVDLASPFFVPTPFRGEIGPRPVGPCPMHPYAELEADGRCPALDAGYQKPPTDIHGCCPPCDGRLDSIPKKIKEAEQAIKALKREIASKPCDECREDGPCDQHQDLTVIDDGDGFGPALVSNSGDPRLSIIIGIVLVLSALGGVGYLLLKGFHVIR